MNGRVIYVLAELGGLDYCHFFNGEVKKENNDSRFYPTFYYLLFGSHTCTNGND
jgi:hypothetical protein